MFLAGESQKLWNFSVSPKLESLWASSFGENCVFFCLIYFIFCFVSLPPKESFLTRDGETKGKRNFSRRALNNSLLTRLADISSGYAKQVYCNREWKSARKSKFLAEEQPCVLTCGSSAHSCARLANFYWEICCWYKLILPRVPRRRSLFHLDDPPVFCLHWFFCC